MVGTVWVFVILFELDGMGVSCGLCLGLGVVVECVSGNGACGRVGPASHDHASTTGHPSSLGGSLRRRSGNIFDDLAHELARRSRTLRIPITPHLLSYLKPLLRINHSRLLLPQIPLQPQQHDWNVVPISHIRLYHPPEPHVLHIHEAPPIADVVAQQDEIGR